MFIGGIFKQLNGKAEDICVSNDKLYAVTPKKGKYGGVIKYMLINSK